MSADEDELSQARREADMALRRAKARRSWAERLAEGWRDAREDNGFREMIRKLPPTVGEGRQ